MYLLGLNHKTAPIQIREQFFLNPLQQDLLLSGLKNNPVVNEAFVLSTCNRIEIYLKRSDSSADISFILPLIEKVKKLRFDFDPKANLYTFEGPKAIEHLLRVTCGLDSLILGEKQILGQVKHAADRARDAGTLSKYFNILTNIAIRAGKKARNETAISQGGSSISWAAIEMAQKNAGTLKDKSALVIGAGKMGEIALKHLTERGIAKTFLMNRTGEKAQDLAQRYNGVAASFMDIKELLTEVDICFCAVGAPHFILNKEIMTKIMDLRQGRPLVMLDISMPRNIDPEVGTLKDIHLNSIDDLDKVVNESLKKRESAVPVVEEIIRQKILEFHDKINRLQLASGSDFFEPAENLD